MVLFQTIDKYKGHMWQNVGYSLFLSACSCEFIAYVFIKSVVHLF